MKFKQINIPKFYHSDEFGECYLKDVKVLVDFDLDIDSTNFDQENHEYFLDSDEIDRVAAESAGKFYDQNAAAILKQERELTSAEIYGIKNFLGLNGSELGLLIGLNKGGVSKILSDKQKIFTDKAMLLLSRLNEELLHRGSVRTLVNNLKTRDVHMHITSKSISANHLAEVYIRRYEKMEDHLTPMKLQKLLYYTQGVSMARCGVKIFNEPILAWDKGPVVREVWLRHQGMRLLTGDTSLDVSDVESDEVIKAVIEEVVSLYGVYSAEYLSQKTHREKPWSETKSNEPISDELLVDFFGNLII